MSRKIWVFIVAAFFVIALPALILARAGRVQKSQEASTEKGQSQTLKVDVDLVLVNATVTAILGILIAMGWPSTSVWAIGTIVGINLLTTGMSRLMLGTSMRTVERRMAA